uniref:ATP synthase complex subunit 8 n=1 Tax=Dudusa sphingiformis TaxID=1857673 RepID=A0A8F2T9V4_9NEOP|nr:ATP synthase F0 subunit 8 [Dudusa sphingiformis]
MPQMMPINWLLFFFFFIFIYLIFNILNYYIYNIKSPNFMKLSNNYKNKTYKNLYWKW